MMIRLGFLRGFGEKEPEQKREIGRFQEEADR